MWNTYLIVVRVELVDGNISNCSKFYMQFPKVPFYTLLVILASTLHFIPFKFYCLFMFLIYHLSYNHISNIVFTCKLSESSLSTLNWKTNWISQIYLYCPTTKLINISSFEQKFFFIHIITMQEVSLLLSNLHLLVKIFLLHTFHFFGYFSLKNVSIFLWVCRVVSHDYISFFLLN